MDELVVLEGLKLDFYQGWDRDSTLDVVLERSFIRDLSLGYTQYGPQRADLLIKLRGNPVHEVLSRGEQKLLAYALQLAQGLLLKKMTGKSCIYLFDDLFSGGSFYSCGKCTLDEKQLAVVLERSFFLNDLLLHMFHVKHMFTLKP
ncbi:MAG: hypothetical protein O7C59_09525, partial [Rickettsia endosymbiont of Ixodes persulcatus]|nr:hypothetical protein [Rickettsia endosymbiont of Ixodes persulcatus]